MDLGYQRSKKISTLDLPWVICDPPLIFEFNNATSIEFGIELAALATGSQVWDVADVVSMGAQLLLKVTRSDGMEYELGNAESIQSLIDNTHPEFVRDVILGWFYLEATNRMRLKKKLNSSKSP